MVSSCFNAFVNGKSTALLWGFDEHVDRCHCQHLDYYWPSKTSRLQSMTSGTLGRDLQLAVYRTSYKKVYDPLSQLGPVPNLKTTMIHTLILTNYSQGVGSEGLTPCEKKLPAMQKLKLVYYAWKTPLEGFSRIWDFSMLRCLSTDVSDFVKLMSRAPLEDLVHLRTLHLSSTWYQTNEEVLLTWGHILSIIDSCPSLECLKLDCKDWQKYLSMSSVDKIGPRLKKLRLRDPYKAIIVPQRALTEGLSCCPSGIWFGATCRKYKCMWQPSINIWSKRPQRFFCHTGSVLTTL